MEVWNSCVQLFVILFLTIGSCLFSPFHCLDDHHHQPRPKVSLFVFGDSLLDPGNNNYINTTTNFQANFSPYGETFFKYPTGRFSDGRLIQDFIAEFAKLPLIPSYFKAKPEQLPFGVNFASGGAGALVETNAEMVVDMKTQFSYFDKIVSELSSKLGQKKVNQLLSDAVYLINLGTNDLLSPNPIFDSFSQKEYMGIVIGNYTDSIKELHDKGARKFGFINMGPLGCLPNLRAHKKVVDGKCDEEIMTLVKSFNTEFSNKLKQLEKQLKGSSFQYSKLDLFTAASDIIDNPSKYGFKEVKTACCGSGPYRGVYSCGGKRGIKEFQLCDNVEEYLFFDSHHPNERGHLLLAELFWNGVPTIRGLEIYKQGGRKFGFLNLGPLGCLPSIKVNTNGECAEEITALAKLHNLMFIKKMKEMEEILLGFDDRYYYSIFDFAGATAEMATASSEYGFKEVNSASCGNGPFRGINSCGRKRNNIISREMKEYFEFEFEVCENADEYLFFDANHPTEAAYRHFAKLMWSGNQKLTGDYNLKSLFQLTL